MISQYVGKKQKAESDRRWDDAINKAEASRKARENYKQVKKSERAKAKADKILAKNEKIKYKETIKQYRKEINAGESAIGKLYNKLTDADKYQAEIMYDQRHKKNKLETHSERSRRESMERKNQLGKAPTLEELRKRRDRNNI